MPFALCVVDALDHFIDIYSHCAAEYHRLIAAEDVDGNLPRAPRTGRESQDTDT